MIFIVFLVQYIRVLKQRRNILKSFINIRSIKDFRQVNDIYRISRSIYTSIKQRPGMFSK